MIKIKLTCSIEIFLSFAISSGLHRTSGNSKIIPVVNVRLTARFKLKFFIFFIIFRFQIGFTFQRTYFCGVILRNPCVVSKNPSSASIFRLPKRPFWGAVRRTGERGSSWSGRVRAQPAQRASDPSGRRRLALTRPACPPTTETVRHQSSHWLPRKQLHTTTDFR